ncbi:hypothetical protein NIES970_07020 [[Synechococcus] sp. NIES-970]|uniref:hypothetical protein n=1 Tax=Picosynechococcus sp. NKBG15041c TaxID=1407650 RepID=UPI0004230740|nr:hypothetical protein [Picosynechococcus sp. NKBG15041c]BAW95789.1 hypothetical protein NIES970_07020 [[Synechococcus] sp. NIES-970]
MNDPFSRNIQFSSSGLGCVLSLILIAALLTSVGLGWVVNGLIILVVLIPVAIALGVVGFQWWLKRNLVEAACPVCSYEFTGLNNSMARCPSCGEVVQITEKTFQRSTPEGTVEVAAVEVESTADIDSDGATVKTVEVQVLEPGQD